MGVDRDSGPIPVGEGQTEQSLNDNTHLVDPFRSLVLKKQSHEETDVQLSLPTDNNSLVLLSPNS